MSAGHAGIIVHVQLKAPDGQEGHEKHADGFFQRARAPHDMQQCPAGQNIKIGAKAFDVKIAELGNNAFINGNIGTSPISGQANRAAKKPYR